MGRLIFHRHLCSVGDYDRLQFNKLKDSANLEYVRWMELVSSSTLKDAFYWRLKLLVGYGEEDGVELLFSQSLTSKNGLLLLMFH